MRQPDRFERIASNAVICTDSWGRIVTEKDLVILLRRQHAAYVRLAKSKYPEFDLGYSKALTDVLDALARYNKGLP
jgi:hypothetical protein